MIALVLIGDAVLRAGWGQAALLAPWPLLAVWCVYLALYASAVVTDADAIEVHNLLRRTRVPWPQVADIRMGYQLVVFLRDGRRIACFGGPVLSRPRQRGSGARMGSLRPTDADAAPQAPTGSMQADLIRERWESARGTAADGPVVRSWDLVGLLTLAALVVWAALAVLIAYGR